MARPRTSAKVLELRGAFKENPQRARQDLEGAGPFNALPPAHLDEKYHASWNYIVERLPKVALSSSEELLVESAARVYARYREIDPSSEEFRRLASTLMQHLKELGMTVNARAKLGPSAEKSQTNRFGALKSG